MRSTWGSTWIATAKPSRAYIPDEYVFTGASMKSELGERHDVVETLVDLLAGEAEHDPVDGHVLPAGDLGVEAGSQLDEGRHPAIDGEAPPGRLRDPGEELERRGLAGPVLTDHAEGAAPGNLEHTESRAVKVWSGRRSDRRLPLRRALLRVLNWFLWRNRR